MTRRGKLALALGLGVYVGAWAFGSETLYPPALGLIGAVALASAAVQLAAKPMRVRRAVGTGEHVEGDDVPVAIEVDPEGPTALVAASVVESVSRLGEQRAPLHRHGGFLRARYLLEALPRGRYALEGAEVVVEDAFGLARRRVPLPGAGALLVFPRLVELDAVFSEAGAHAQDGRRLLLRRPTGFDLHSVREYEQGESLRKVHWRTTARRGQLMVKELEDEPRDEVAVVLDADATAVVGPRGDTSFDAQVRAAGSLLRAQVWRGRRALLVVNGREHEVQRVQSYTGDWRRALEILAAVEPTGTTSLGALLADESTPAARAVELAVVTARLEPRLVDRLVQRALSRRRSSVVYVDAPTFAGAQPAREPGLLRLQAAGVPVAVVRRGDDLAAALGAIAQQEAAHA